MNRVLTVGVFDYFHLGHLRLFMNAKQFGDYLIVAVQDESHIKKTKPNATILYSTKERVELVSSLRIVDQVVVYTDVDKIVQTVDFDTFVKGPDQNHKGFETAVQWCVDHNKTVITLPRTEGISSSLIKKQVDNLE